MRNVGRGLDGSIGQKVMAWPSNYKINWSKSSQNSLLPEVSWWMIAHSSWQNFHQVIAAEWNKPWMLSFLLCLEPFSGWVMLLGTGNRVCVWLQEVCLTTASLWSVHLQGCPSGTILLLLSVQQKSNQYGCDRGST